MFLRIGKFIHQRWIVSVVAAVFLVGGVWYFFYSGSEPKEDFIVATRQRIVQQVSVTGTVKPASSVDLAFERTGRVVTVAHDIGARVAQGALLVRLDGADLVADLAQADAAAKAFEAKLAQLKSGTRVEEINISEVKVANAKRALEDARANLAATIRDGYIKVDDAVRNKSDQLFSNPRGSSPQLNYTADLQLEIDIEATRPRIEGELNLWKLGLDKSDLALARTTLNDVGAFLDLIIRLLNGLSATTGLTQATLDDYRSDVATGRTNVSTAILNLTAADEKYRTAESSLALAEEELLLKRAGVRTEEIQASEADVEKAHAAVASARAQLSKTLLTSPISGTVTKQDAKVGQIVSANTIIASVMSDAKFQIEAQVPEADIAKVNIGDTAKVTLDAYPSTVVFETRVVKIDPAATVVEGVPTYKTTLQFEKADERVKSGMTANVDIATDERADAVAIPQRALKTENGQTYVEVRKGDSIDKINVETGLRGSDGTIEIVSGLSEGDRVILFREDGEEN